MPFTVAYLVLVGLLCGVELDTELFVREFVVHTEHSLRMYQVLCHVEGIGWFWEGIQCELSM